MDADTPRMGGPRPFPESRITGRPRATVPLVMAGLGPAIHAFMRRRKKAWIPGPSPGMTGADGQRVDPHETRWSVDGDGFQAPLRRPREYVYSILSF